MKIALYGMPCTGKSTLLKTITDARIINGSQELNRICGGSFSDLTEDEKHQIRIKYTEYINTLEDEMIISDGHYSFMDNVVFTESDGDLYDIFIYLYCSPETLKSRYELSKKNAKFANESVESISQWQEFEINKLREESHKRNKDFYVISDNEDGYCSFNDFLTMVRNGFSSYTLASDISKQIMKNHSNNEILYIVDGDKTIITQDSYRFCCDGKTKVFDGNFYTGYQSFLFKRELQDNLIEESKIAQITVNNKIFDEISSKKYIILSSGIKNLWNNIAKEKCFRQIYASPYICADTKYYVVKILREHGYIIYAYGDSKIDLYMLREANRGTLYIGKRISRSLKKESLAGLKLIYDHSLVILEYEDFDTASDIAICKSNSGINGNRLAVAHMRLGEKLGTRISEMFPDESTAILVLERGGRFFGDGIYIGFGGTFHYINPKTDKIPKLDTDRVIIVDSVINTGKSLMKIIEHIRELNPKITVIIAANVIQAEAIKLFNNYLVFAIRISKNSFIGRNQVKQIGITGPDTADRLFNLIEKRF